MPACAQSQSSAASRRGGPSATQVSLPAYEPPLLPLSNDAALRLANIGDASKLKAMLAEAEDLLSTATADLAELANMENSQGPTAEQKALLDESDVRMRELVDMSTLLEENSHLLGNISTEEQNSARRLREDHRRRRVEGGDEEEEHDHRQAAANESPWARYKKQMETTTQALKGKTDQEKYSNANKYLQYRRQKHDALYPGRPHPRPSQLFDASGHVIVDIPVGGGGGGGNDSDSDDFEIAQESGVVKCPLTMRYFEFPVTSIKCPHSFEKEAIVDMMSKAGRDMRGRPQAGKIPGQIDCPYAGCDKKLMENDLQDDPALLRRVRRHREEEDRRARERMMGSDDEEEEEDQEEPSRIRKENEEAVNVKKENVKKTKRGRHRVLDLEDDDDED